MAAPSTSPKNFYAGVLRQSDGTGSPVTLACLMQKGDYAIGPLRQELNEDMVITSLTQVIGLVPGAPLLPTLSVSCYVGNLVGSSATAPGSMLEFVTGKGAYSANISTRGANQRMTVDTRLTIEGTSWGDTADETIDAEDCRYSADFAVSADGNTLSFSAQVLGSVVITNSTNVVTYSQAA